MPTGEEPKTLVYLCFKEYNNYHFEEELPSNLKVNNQVYINFEKNFVNVINMCLKNKKIGVNTNPICLRGWPL